MGERLFADELKGFLFLLLEVFFVFFNLSFEDGDLVVFFLYFLLFDSDVGFEVQQIFLSGVNVILEHLYDGLVLFFDVFGGRSAVEVEVVSLSDGLGANFFALSALELELEFSNVGIFDLDLGV